MLCTGMVPALFEGEEKEGILILVKETMLRSGVSSSDKDVLWDLFVDTCRQNLHIVLALSPSGDKLRKRCRNFPGLLTNCQIDWLFDWQEDALQLIAKEAITESDILDGDVIHKIRSQMVVIHKNLKTEAERFCCSSGRNYVVTSSHYLNFIECYKTQLKGSFKRLNNSIARLSKGLRKLEEAAMSVSTMNADLNVKMVRLFC
jgi:dynein heavy chain